MVINTSVLLIKKEVLGYEGNIISGGLSNIVEDLTPQLGGPLDAQGNNITDVANLTASIVTSTQVNAISELSIPTSTDPVLDRSGEIALNVTFATSSLNVNIGGTEMALYPVQYKTITIASSTLDAYAGQTASSTISLGVASPQGETWVSIECFTSAGTAEVEFGDGTNWMDYQLLTTSVSRDTSLSNNTFTMLEKRYIRVGQTASLTDLSCSVGIRQNP